MLRWEPPPIFSHAKLGMTQGAGRLRASKPSAIFWRSRRRRARGIAYRWEQYRRLWWVFAGLATCILVREFLPIPLLFGPDDNE